ncbi:ATP-binding protein [Deferribacter autotrophicus]|uniref:ATP-binding protein n=1 Tax=Deferribacter autotrophicus TaxID=500465 RepID=A0A5A8F163_9BACT|nr:AAA family ATPase [Deferribacter autotrophicus]KAA0257650.1 ATP-binding protein [Deferribacter autotrophicus]
MINEIIDQIELTLERLKTYLPDRKRPYFDNIPIDGIRGALVYGLRGVGKTTFLIDKISNCKLNFLYLSADNPSISSLPLYDIVSAIFKRGYDGVVIDEVHHGNKWSEHVKALYDDYPGNTIWISDSSNLILKRAVADLSRRFVQFRIPLMSFREYLFLTQNILIETIDPFNIDKNIFSMLRNINILKLFADYINTGIRPIFIEGEYCLRLKGLLEKSIYYDIPFYVSSIQDNHLRVMNAILGHLITAPIPTINISGMCSEWNLGKEKLYNLLYVMEQSELINIIRKPSKSVYTKGSKIFLSDPSVYSCFKGNVGNAREAFVVMCLKEKYNVFASKDEKDCDFIVDDIKVEVGGKNKKMKNADFVISDEIDVPVRNKIPLWMLGFLY